MEAGRERDGYLRNQDATDDRKQKWLKGVEAV